MAGPMISVPSPTRQSRKGGIKSVVGEFEALPRLAVANALQWVSDGCEFPKAAPGLCYAEVPVEGNKEFEGIDQGTGPIFALYAGVRCYLGNDTDYADRARALLEQGEGRGVEEVLWEWAATMGGAPLPADSLLDAISLAEESADSYYVGQPVLIMSRRVAVHARAAKAIFGDEETGRLWTANGTPVIATAAASDSQLSIMGWPTIYASAFTEIQAYDPTVNQELAIAERVYGIAVDCAFIFTYAVEGLPDVEQPPAPPITATISGTPASGNVVIGSNIPVVITASAPPADGLMQVERSVGGAAWSTIANVDGVPGAAVSWTFDAPVSVSVGSSLQLRAKNPGDPTIITNVLTYLVVAAELDLEGQTVAELRQFAADHEPPITIPSGANKAEIIAAIRAALDEEG